MATVAKLTVSNAMQVDAANWVTSWDVFGPQLIPSPAPRGPCVVQALTAPANSPAEWGQIAWAGGEPVPGRPNQRIVRVGRVISAAGMGKNLRFRRQVTAHDFVDGKRDVGKKAFIPWAPDDSQPKLLTLDPGPDDRLYDTDGPDLPVAARTSETYNNFRQWVEWVGVPWSDYGYWYFRARWKDQKVTLKEVGQGSIILPSNPYYP